MFRIWVVAAARDRQNAIYRNEVMEVVVYPGCVDLSAQSK